MRYKHLGFETSWVTQGPAVLGDVDINTLGVGGEVQIWNGVLGADTSILDAAAPTTTATAINASSDPVTITIASAVGFPATASYFIKIDNELLLVTSGQGTTSWIATRAQRGTVIAAHLNGATVTMSGIDGATDPTLLDVASFAEFPAAGIYLIKVDNEILKVTGLQGTLEWEVRRAMLGTTAAPHPNLTPVFMFGEMVADLATTANRCMIYDVFCAGGIFVVGISGAADLTVSYE